MLYRIRLDLAFPSPDAPDQAYDYARWLLAHAVNIAPGTDREEIGYIQLERCYHDEEPVRECQVIRRVQVPTT